MKRLAIVAAKYHDVCRTFPHIDDSFAMASEADY